MLARPVRKIYYNLILTALSVAAAFLLGTVRLWSLVSDVDVDGASKHDPCMVGNLSPSRVKSHLRMNEKHEVDSQLSYE